MASQVMGVGERGGAFTSIAGTKSASVRTAVSEDGFGTTLGASFATAVDVDFGSSTPWES